MASPPPMGRRPGGSLRDGRVESCCIQQPPAPRSPERQCPGERTMPDGASEH